MKLSVYMYFFLPSSFFMLLLLYLLKQRSYSIIYEALLCVIFFFVHTDVGQILKIICLWYQSVIIHAELVNKHKLYKNEYFKTFIYSVCLVFHSSLSHFTS